MSKYFFLVFLFLWACGCSLPGSGILYTHVILPYSPDFNNTPVGSKQCVLEQHRFREPVSGYDVTVEWSADRISSAAEEAGITHITCMDEQTISFLLGIYTRRKLIVYGD